MDKNSIPSSSKSLDQQHVQKTKLNKGYAVIFNHEKFEPSLFQKDRLGTEHDVKALKDVFELFHVEVIVRNNLTIKEIDSEVLKLQYFDFTPYECLVIVILTHGKENNFLYAFDCIYNLHDRIVNQIVIPNKSLIGKPKIFIIQACKGDIDSNAFIQKDARVSPSSIQIPFITDMFFAFSTYEGFASNRDIRSGGIFIQSFCQMLREYGSTEVIHKIMERVTKNLVINNQMQVPTAVTTMTKPFIFGDIGRGSVTIHNIVSDEILIQMFREMLQNQESPELISQITKELIINQSKELIKFNKSQFPTEAAGKLANVYNPKEPQTKIINQELNKYLDLQLPVQPTTSELVTIDCTDESSSEIVQIPAKAIMVEAKINEHSTFVVLKNEVEKIEEQTQNEISDIEYLPIADNTATDESTKIQDLPMTNSNTLDLNHLNYDDITLMKTLYMNVKLSNINLVEYYKYTEESWEQCNHNLRFLSIYKCGMNVNHIFSILQIAENLETLEISECRIVGPIEGNSHKYILKKLKKFKLFSTFGSDMYDFLNKLLESTPNLRNLDISTRDWKSIDPVYAKFIEKTVKINNLKLEEYIFNTAVTPIFIKSISEGQTLITDLVVAGFITNKDVITICNNIPNLRSLRITNCSKISDSGVMDLWKMKNLNRLCLHNCTSVTSKGFIAGLKEKNNNMQTLELSLWKSSPFDKLLTHIANLFKFLTELKLDSLYGISENGIHSVWRNLLLLKKLTISCSVILVTDLTYTGRNIKNNTGLSQCSIARLKRLTHLNLNFPNKITIVTLKEISKLKELVYLNANFSDSEIELMDLVVLSECKLLEHLEIKLNKIWYQKNKDVLKNHFSRIKYFDISKNNN